MNFEGSYASETKSREPGPWVSSDIRIVVASKSTEGLPEAHKSVPAEQARESIQESGRA
jgi:hypothetical protein